MSLMCISNLNYHALLCPNSCKATSEPPALWPDLAVFKQQGLCVLNVKCILNIV